VITMIDILKEALIKIRDMEQEFHPKLHRIFNEMGCCDECLKRGTPCDIHNDMFNEIKTYCEEQERLLHSKMRKIAKEALAKCKPSSGK